jgi:hypothetical protein
MKIWYILFGTIFLVLECCTKKNLETLGKTPAEKVS